MTGVFQPITEAVLPAGTAPDVVELFRSAGSEIRECENGASLRRANLAKIRDQWEGEARATSEIYHPAPFGLTEEQLKAYREILARSHVNLIETAVDRLTNSIHAGLVSRRSASAELQELLRRPEHAVAMAQLCENAYAYGTGYMVPVLNELGELRYWLPDPINTMLVTAPGDVATPIGLLELTRTNAGKDAVVRFITEQHEGLLMLVDRQPVYTANAHGLNFLPAVVAYGRTMTHRGKKYGRSLVATLPDSCIKVTRNEANTELLRDRQTQALLVIEGEPSRVSTNEPQASNKFMQFPREGGTARYETPESRLEDVIKVGERQLNNAAVQSNLPLDAFRPELVQGSDASATAARIRAFPLQQRMVRLGNEWVMVELRAGQVIGALMLQSGGQYRGQSLEALQRELQIAVKLRPSLPEAEAETLSVWQQKTANNMATIEEAIEFYSDHLTTEQKEALARAWKVKNDPTFKTGEVFQYHVEGGVLTVNEVRSRLGLAAVPWGDITLPELKANPDKSSELEDFKREIAKALYSGATTKEVMANLTNLKVLVAEVGLPGDPGYVEPFLPVVGPPGQPVTGGVVLDPQGDIVGGATAAAPVTEPTRTPINPAGQAPANPEEDGPDET